MNTSGMSSKSCKASCGTTCSQRSEFHSTEISFLGFIVSKCSLQMDPKKTKAVRDFPTPSSVKEVEHFLALLAFTSSSSAVSAL